MRTQSVIIGDNYLCPGLPIAPQFLQKQLAELEVLAEGTSDSDGKSMVPPIYDKSAKEFHNKRKKGNCWKNVERLLNAQQKKWNGDIN